MELAFLLEEPVVESTNHGSETAIFTKCFSMPVASSTVFDGGANSRWWGEIFFQLIQKRTATFAVGTAKFASRDRRRDKTACDYFVEKISNTTHNILKRNPKTDTTTENQTNAKTGSSDIMGA
jgi:hypothetical protein